MSKSRKKCGCDSDISNIVDTSNNSRSRQSGRRRFMFPTDIRALLILVAEDDDEDNRVSIVLDACSNHCFIEDARVIAVMDNTVVIRDCDKFRFVCIGCICEVMVDCDVILDELFEQNSLSRD
ncbi:MAG: hypothetical protein H7Y18_09070 [Clostridiaceae bacterium]|nr:hypothetical protein [Clostridiaceae bacterium]